nr:L-seryl-tRNA(Sec) selenium transferase [Candidatus Acidoferrales bacterium]
MPTRSKTESAGKPANTLLRAIPSVDELLAGERLSELSARVGRHLIVEAARSVIAAFRTRISEHPSDAPSKLKRGELAGQLIGEIIADVESALRPSLRPVINATGVVLHTNLGRAPLGAEFFEHIRAVASQYSNLEYDLETGVRGSRDVHTSRLLQKLTGAESGIVVNNNAAAVFLVLAALARGGEVIVSRGELIEIGDGFRIPDIMAESGAALREVGTTNRTRLSDYERAINERTRLLLRVHRSNFQIEGFTAQPSLEELVKLGRKTSLPVYEDLGSGCLVNLSSSGVAEPVVRESLAAGVSIISFSGDKLLGGPQAGIIVGEKELIARIRRHPMFRALRVDKLTIVALEATLLAYLRGEGASGYDAIPAISMIRASAEEISARAKKIIELLRAKISADAAKFQIREAESVIGGGSTPGQLLPTQVIAIECLRSSSAELEERLRAGVSRDIPIIARVENDQLILDLRTVFPEQESVLVERISAALAK